MKCLERFNNRMSLSGKSQREYSINNSKSLLSYVFEDDPSFNSEFYIWSLNKDNYTKEDKSIPVRMYKEKFSNANGDTIKFQSLYENPIVVGDLFFDGKRNCYWLCTASFNRGDINFEGEFTQCNWNLRWQNSKGEVVNYPCYDSNTTQYNSGEQTNRQFIIESSQHLIQLPCDKNTLELRSPKRFYLDYSINNMSTFEITQNDTTSRHIGDKGIVKITLMATPSNKETDRPDLGICDYVEPKLSKPDCDIEIQYDSNIIKSGGKHKTFTALYPSNLNWNQDLKWKIYCDFENELNIKENSKTISISIDNDLYIDEEFRISLVDNNDNEKSYVIVKIESLW